MLRRFGPNYKKIWKNFRSGFKEFTKSYETTCTIILYSTDSSTFDTVKVELIEGFKSREAEEWLDGMEAAKVRREEREAQERNPEVGGGKKGKGGSSRGR